VHGTDVLGMLLKGSFAMLGERLRDVSDDEWRARALPRANKPGFILWHCARILDWTVSSAIQGTPQVAESQAWRERFPADAGAGFGISLELADRIADGTPASEVGDYLADVRTAALTWFEAQTDQSLDVVPPMKENQPPFYRQPQVWAEIADLEGLPVWQLLLRPAGAHIRRHMGEYDLLVDSLRAATPPG
jgi:DinB family protein